MNIRSVTYFLEPAWPLTPQSLDPARRFLAEASAALAQAGYQVQTLRLATTPFPTFLPGLEPDEVEEAARGLDRACAACGIDYLSLGPALPDQPESYEVLPSILRASERVFAGAIIAEPKRGISVPAVRSTAAAIWRAAQIGGSGFGNLRLAALACVPGGSPFFPAAYHPGGAPSFAFATEAASLAVEATAEAQDLGAARERLRQMVEAHGARLAQVGRELEARLGTRFSGIDFSLAPYPQQKRSLGAAVEQLGVPRVGLAGTALAAALLADTLAQADFPRAGFSGLFFPVFEDSVLALRAAEGALTLSGLMVCASMCGAGLDTLPLPGSVTPDQLAAILLDLAALALRHRKPLTARLMPLPGKRAGEEVAFDFAYFAATRVMAPESEGVQGLLSQAGWIPLEPLIERRAEA